MSCVHVLHDVDASIWCVINYQSGNLWSSHRIVWNSLRKGLISTWSFRYWINLEINGIRHEYTSPYPILYTITLAKTFQGSLNLNSCITNKHSINTVYIAISNTKWPQMQPDTQEYTMSIHPLSNCSFKGPQIFKKMSIYYHEPKSCLLTQLMQLCVYYSIAILRE